MYCSNRGICDLTSGNCNCYPNFINSNCDTYQVPLLNVLNASDILVASSTLSSYTKNVMHVLSTTRTKQNFNLILVNDSTREIFKMTSSGDIISSYGGLNIAGLDSHGGQSIYTSGIRVNGGMSINNLGFIMTTNGITMKDSGLSVSGGGMITTTMTVASGGLYVLSGGISIITQGLRAPTGGVVITAGGATVWGGGITISSQIDGIPGDRYGSDASGMTVSAGGMYLQNTKGITVLNGGIYIASGGFQFQGNSLFACSNGLTLYSGGLTISTGLTISSNGLVVTGGATTMLGGLLVTGGMSVNSGGMLVTNGLSIVSSGLYITMGALHWGIFEPIDYYFSVNVNFFLCPSEGMSALFLGLPSWMLWPSYRSMLVIIFAILSIPFCYLYIGVAWLFFCALGGYESIGNKQNVGSKNPKAVLLASKKDS